MALVVNLKCVENLHGKSDRVAKVSFRGLSQQSSIIRNAKSVAYFGQSFEWPVARAAEEDEYLEIQICNYNKYLSNKVIGTYTMLMQQLIHDGELKIYEPLVDINHKLMDTTITFEVHYYSPDGKVGKWKEDDFAYPITDDTESIRMGDDAISLSSSNLARPSALEETHYLRFAAATRASDAGSQIGRESVDGIDLPGEDTASQTAMVETFFHGKKRRPDLLEQEMHKPRDFQICITVIEAQQLAGLNVDPVIKVEVGDEYKYTSIKQSTNCPYYNEYFVFDFKESPAMIFDKMITLTAYHAYNIPGRQFLKATNTVAGKKVIGCFKCDVGTVFTAQDHMFYHKWAVLLDSGDIAAGPTGFIKCDIAVIGRGDNVKTPKGVREDDTNNIEGNLLLPAGVPLHRQRAVYTVTIYRAEDVPRTDLGIMASVRKAMSLGNVAFVDAFVRVSFVGLVGKTTVRKSYDPEWKEVLHFADMFPPLCNRIKIQICDSDAVKDDNIATHFLELSQIMDPGGDTEGIIPTFGPSWVNFYGAPRDFKFIAQNEELNDGLGEGSAYRGRLLLSLTTTLIEDETGGGSSVTREKLMRTGGVMDYQPRKEFLLYSTFFGASMIDRELKDKRVYFELSVGRYGNVVDGRGEKAIIKVDSDEEESDEEDSPNQNLLKKRREEEEKLLCNSTTDPVLPQSLDGTHYFIPFGEKKPCLFVCALFEDLRKRLFHCNLLEGVVDALDEGLDDVKHMIASEHQFAHRRVRGVMEELIKNCEKYISQSGNLSVGAGSGKTKLDKYRLKAVKNRMDRFKTRAKEIKRLVKPENVKDFFRELKQIAIKMRHLSKEPQHSLPDVFIWMLHDKKRIAYYRFPAKDLLHTTLNHYQGKNCGKRQTIFLRKPGKMGLGQSGWTMQAKLDVSLWFGEMDPKKRIKPYLDALPEGFETECKFGENSPPTAIIYPDRHKFQLRAYIFQARSLIGSDDTGLSDPFARVIISNQCKSTRYVDETLSPSWDETLVFDDVVFHAPLEELKLNPPVTVVEIYDYDTVGKPEFLGRCMAKPKIKPLGERYDLPEWPAQLEWYDVYRGTRQAGELLAAFELLEYSAMDELPALPEVTKRPDSAKELMPIPPTIKPTLSKYRVEIMFWGVRDLKRIQLMTVDKPRMDAECAGQVLKSKRITHIDKNSNFDNPVQYMDVMLPDNDMYWPPLTLRCVDCRNFGREILVGTATITQLPKYLHQSPEERRRREDERKRRELEQLNKMQKPNSVANSRSMTPSVGRGSGSGSGVNVPDIQIDMTDGDSAPVINGSIKGSLLAAGSIAAGSIDRRSVAAVSLAPASRSGSIRQGPDHVSVNMDGRSVSRLGQVPDVAILHPGPTATPLPPIQQSPGAPPGGPGEGGPVVMEEIPTGPGEPPPVAGPHPKEAAALAAAADKQKDNEEDDKPTKKRELIADLDWWSKYYVTQEDIYKYEKKVAEGKGDKERKELFSDAENSDLSSDDGLGLVINSVDYGSLDQDALIKLKEEQIAKRKAIEEENNKKKGKKKKKKKKKLKMKDKMKKMKGFVNEAFSKEEETDDDEYDDDPENGEDRSHIARIRKYPCELERVAGHGNFEELFHTFPLYRGKKIDDEDDDHTRIAGKFKGNICIYRLDTDENDDKASVHSMQLDRNRNKKQQQRQQQPNLLKMKLLEGLPPPKPFEVHVMVYIIKATDLHPVDLNGKADPYLVVKCGREEVNDKENKICNQLNPVFGRLFEFDAAFPMDSMLQIKVMDYDLMSADDLIGETTIDLENRYFHKMRPRCGLQHEYEVFGYNIWRDPMKPTAILERLCKEHKLEPAEYRPNSVYVGGHSFKGNGQVELEGGELIHNTEPLALEALKGWDKIAGYNLIPEHVESRALYCEERPGVEQGIVEMWVDMFPKDMPAPSVTVDITPRQPKTYELRCIIWNTDEVILEDTNMLTGEASSDIFVKGYMKGKGEDDQSTDVHYRSLTGEGNFNWRYVFPFDYLKAEEKIVYRRSEGPLDMSDTEVKVPPKLTIQIWDADLVSADDFLGSTALDLNRIPKPSKDAKFCRLPNQKTRYINLFKNKRCKGWWPVTTTEEGEQRIVGKVEAELQLLTAEEAERAPVGLGREDPDGLPEPNRPDSSFLWFMNPLKTLKYVIWKNYKWVILKVFLFLLLVAFIALMIYTMPGQMTTKMFGN